MMKKMIALVICLALLTSAGTAFARSSSLREGVKEKYLLLATLKEKAQAVRQNEAEIRSLKTQIKQEITIIRAITARLRKQQVSISTEQLAAVRKALTGVRQAHSLLSSTGGGIHQKSLQIKSNRQNRNLPGFVQNLNELEAMQQERIRLLKDAANRLHDLESSLNAVK